MACVFGEMRTLKTGSRVGPKTCPFWKKTQKKSQNVRHTLQLASGIWASSPGAPPTQCAGLPSGVVYQCARLPVALLPWNFAVEL